MATPLQLPVAGTGLSSLYCRILSVEIYCIGEVVQVCTYVSART